MYLAHPGLVSWLLDPFSAPPVAQEIRPMYEHTADVTDEDLDAVRALCTRLGCKPIDLVGCWLSESTFTAHAQNPTAFAAGVFQAMPSTLRNVVHFTGDAAYQEPPGAYAAARARDDRAEMHRLDKALSDAFCRLSLREQLVFAERYYAPHARFLTSPAACYMVTFAPAWVAHASDAAWIICARDGRSGAGRPAEESELWYAQNEGLDVDKDGAITPGDLESRIAAKLATPRGRELAARLGAPVTADDVIAAGGAPLFVAPPLDDEPA